MVFIRIINRSKPAEFVKLSARDIKQAMSTVVTLDRLFSHFGIKNRSRQPVYIETLSGPLIRQRSGRWRYGSLDANGLPTITENSPDLLVPTDDRAPQVTHVPGLLEILPSWCFPKEPEKFGTSTEGALDTPFPSDPLAQSQPIQALRFDI